jgi:hypothetical protein
VATCSHNASFGTDATTGKIDVSAISASAPCSTYGPCQISYLVDQIGSDNLYNANPGSITPTFGSSAGPSAGFAAGVFVSASHQYLIAAAGTTIAQPNISFAITYKHTVSNTNVEILFGAGASGGFFFPQYENPNLVELNGGATALPVTASDNAYHTVLAVAGVGGVSGHGWISVDAGTPATSSTIGSDSLILGSALLGAYGPTTYNADMDFEELAIWTSDVSANVSSINSNAHTFWGF